MQNYDALILERRSSLPSSRNDALSRHARTLPRLPFVLATEDCVYEVRSWFLRHKATTGYLLRCFAMLLHYQMRAGLDLTAKPRGLQFKKETFTITLETEA